MLSNLIQSLNQCQHKELIQLCIFDCGTPNIQNDISQAWSGPLYLTSCEMNFTRTYSLNQAVELCPADYVFLCDADMIVPEDLVLQFFRHVGEKKAWFPICFSLRKGKDPIISPDYGWWRDTGFGMAGFRKVDYQELGGHDTNFKTYGDEDIDLFKRSKRDGLKTVRENCLGLFHKWHQKTKFGVDVF